MVVMASLVLVIPHNFYAEMKIGQFFCHFLADSKQYVSQSGGH